MATTGTSQPFPSTLPRSLAAVFLCVAASLANAQQTTTDDDRFVEVQAGYEDVSPQAVSTLLKPVDLRTPNDFARVYRVVGSSGLLARRFGAVTAVFPRSIYQQSTALIPPGTVFYVGKLPKKLQGQGVLAHDSIEPMTSSGAPVKRWHAAIPASPTSSIRLTTPARAVQSSDRRADRPVGDERQHDSPARSAETAGTTSIFESEACRRDRLSYLIGKATAFRRALTTTPQKQ